MREFVLQTIAQKQWIKHVVFAATGASAGFMYYHFIGCNNGTCPISSNPYISTMYGGALGMIISPAKNKAGH